MIEMGLGRGWVGAHLQQTAIANIAKPKPIWSNNSSLVNQLSRQTA